MRDSVTTLLDVLGLLLVSAGAVGGLWPLVGPASLVVGGILVLAGSWVAARGERR